MNDINNKIFDLSEHLYDLSENVFDISQNLNEFKNSVTDLSGNVQEIISNDWQASTILGHGAQIQANANAITAAAGILATTWNVGVTASNTAVITVIVLSLGIASVADFTPSTGIYGSID